MIRRFAPVLTILVFASVACAETATTPPAASETTAPDPTSQPTPDGGGAMTQIDINNPDNTVEAAYDITPAGANEIGDAGNLDGSGDVTVFIETTPEGAYVVCLNGTFTGLTGVSAAHIHQGAAGVNGPPIVDLSPLVTDTSGFGCADTDDETAMAIIADPAGHYLNVHTAAFPNGAIRAQLA